MTAPADRVEPDPRSGSAGRSFGGRRAILRVGGAFVLLVSVVASWRSSGRLGIDDFPSLQLMADGIARGSPIYDVGWMESVFRDRFGVGAPRGMFYPPSTGFALLPLAFLPRRAGEGVWLSVLIGSVILGVRALVRLAAPRWLDAWPLVAGLVLLSAVLRWGMTPMQGAPLVFGLLCLFVAALHTERPAAAFAIAAFVTAFKITLALPFLALLFFHKRTKSLAGAVAIAVGLSAIGFARMGPGALAAYRRNMAIVEASGDINTPNPWEAISIPRCDWTYLFDGLTGSERAGRALGLLLSAAVAVWLVAEGRRLRGPLRLRETTALLLPLACLGSAAVYHHHYDLAVVVVPLLLAALGDECLRRPRSAVALSIPLVAILAVLPVGVVQRVLVQRAGPAALGWLNLAFPVATSLALAGGLVVLARTRRGAPPAAFGYSSEY